MPETRLQKTLARLRKLFDTHSALPAHSVRYALAEVGPIPQRRDPVEIEWVLRAASHQDDTGEILALEPLPRIFVSPSSTKTNAEQHAWTIAKTVEDHLLSFTSATSSDRAAAVAAVLGAVAGTVHDVHEVDAGEKEQVGGAISWPAQGHRVMFSLPNGGPAYSAWITGNLEWVLPYSPALWRHLAHCASVGLRPLVIARKISFSTFPLLKRLGALGMQYYQVPLTSQDVVNSENAERAFPLGPQLITADGLSDHEAFVSVLPRLLANAKSFTPPQSDAIHHAVACGLSDNSTGGPAVLRNWADTTHIEMPRPWKGQITKYVRWLHELESVRVS